MEDQYKIAALIQRCLIGEAKEHEIKEVEEWEKENSQHKEMMHEFKECDWEKQVKLEYDIFLPEEGYERFLIDKRRIDRQRIIRFCSSVAAGILLIISVGVYYFSEKEKQQHYENPIVAQVECAENHKAMLILGNGEKIWLNDSVKTILSDDVVKIRIEGSELQYNTDREGGVQTDNKPSMNLMMTPKGGEYRLKLEDGTRVWLNAETELQFPAKFSGSERKVYIVGEAYFEVAKDSARPFLIQTKKSVIRVLGTSFNVRTYPEDVERTTLIEGSVAIYCSGKIIKIKPNEQWIWNDMGGEVEKVNTRMAVSWKEGYFAFEEQTLDIVFKELGRWYDMNFLVTDPKISALKFTGVFPKYEDFKNVMEIIALTTCVQYRLDKENQVIVNY